MHEALDAIKARARCVPQRTDSFHPLFHSHFLLFSSNSFKDRILDADNVDFSDAAGLDKNRGYATYPVSCA